MKRLVKALGMTLSILLLLAAIGLFLPDRVYQRVAINITQLITSRDLYIGDITIQRGLQTIVEMSDVSFANAEWSDRISMMQAEKLTASINLRALLQGKLEISNISSSKLKLYLEKNTLGQSNWQLSENKRFKPDLSRIKLVELTADNNLIQYVDHAAAAQQTLALQTLDLQVKNSTSFPVLRARGDVNGIPIAINTHAQHTDLALTSSEKESSYQVPFVVEATIGNITANATGNIDLSNSNAMLNSDVSAHVDNLDDLGNLLDIDLPALGPIDLTATLNGSLAMLKNDGMDVTNLNLRLNDENMTLDAIGSLTSVPHDINGEIQLHINTLDSNEILRLINIDTSLSGKAHINAILRIEDKRVDVDLQQGQFNSDQINVQVSGKLTDVLDAAMVAIDIDIQAPDMSLVTQLSGQKMPAEWGPVSATGQLVGSHEQYSVNQINVVVSGDSTANAMGSIGSLTPFKDMQFDVAVNLLNLAEVSAFTTTPLPDIGPFSGDGTVIWSNGKLSLVDAKATYDGQLGIAVATGHIEDLIKFDGVRLRADANLSDFTALDLFTGFTMPPVDEVIVSTNLFSTQARDLSARNLNIIAQKDDVIVSAEGSVDSIIKNKAILDLNLVTEVESIRQIEEWVNRELPDIGPISATARLLGSQQDIELVDVKATINDAVLNGNVRSDVGYLNRMEKLALDVEVNTASVSDTLAKIGYITMVNAPATLSSQVLFDLGESSIRLDKAQLTIGGSSLTGELDLLNFTNPETRPQLSGVIELTDWNLMQLRDHPMGIRQRSGGPASTEATDMLLSDSKLPMALIARNNIDLKIRIGQLMSTLFDVSNATLDIRSENGVLSVGPFIGMVNQGQAEFQMTINTNQSPPAVSLTIALEEFDLARAGLIQNSDLIENTGGTTAMLNLDGRGDSIAQIMASANGEGGLFIEDLVIKQGLLRVLSSDLLDQLVDAINPTKEQNQETRLKCSALTFQLTDGTLETPMGFAVESEKFAILGNANINFNDEAINVMINSKPKKGLGFSLNRFVNLVEINGQLATPQLSLSETGLLRLGASLAAAVASNGVTLLAEGLWDRQQANSDVCAQALGH